MCRQVGKNVHFRCMRFGGFHRTTFHVTRDGGTNDGKAFAATAGAAKNEHAIAVEHCSRSGVRG